MSRSAAGGLGGSPGGELADGAVGGASEGGGAAGGVGAGAGFGDAYAAGGDAAVAGGERGAQLDARFARIFRREDLAEVLQLDFERARRGGGRGKRAQELAADELGR